LSPGARCSDDEEATDMSEPTGEDPSAGRNAADAEESAQRAEAAARRAKVDRDEAQALAETARDAALEAARRAGRFSREFMVTVISVVTTAFGVVVALAWNTALSNALSNLSKGARTVGLFVYAVLVTFLAVIAIVVLSRLARRLGAAPIEFKLEPKKE
jgi:Family of unknown function (DUF5654)